MSGPPGIRAFLGAELELPDEVTTEGLRVLHVGCGTGRHLLGLGVGVDYEPAYPRVREAT